MRSRMLVLGWGLLLIATVCRGGDPYEVSPLQPEVVLRAPWGDGPGEFHPYPSWLGWGETAYFGPYAVTDDGTLVIADKMGGQIEVFAADGTHRQTVVLAEHPSSWLHVAGLALVRNDIYWYQDGLRWNKFFCNSLSGKNGPQEIPVCEPLTGQGTGEGKKHTSRIHYDVRFFPQHDDLLLWTVESSLSYPLVRNGVLLDPARQQAEAKPGWPLPDGRRLVVVRERGAFQVPGQEETGPGDVVIVDAGGRPVRLLLRRRGSFIESRGRFFLYLVTEKIQGRERGYREVWDCDGRLVSRTRMRPVTWERGIMVVKPCRLAPDGTFYELRLGDDGITILHWH